MENNVLRSFRLLGGLMLGSLLSLQAAPLAVHKNTTIGSEVSYQSIIVSNDSVDNVVMLDNMIHVDGFVTWGAYNGGVLHIDVGSDLTPGTNATVLRTALSAEGASSGDISNIIIYAEEGGVVNLNILADCFLTAGLRTTDSTTLISAKANYDSGDSYAQTITFSGQGEIYVNISGGTKLAFDSLYPVTGGSINADGMRFEYNDGEYGYDTRGTRAYIVMDQSSENAIYPKVTFSRDGFDTMNSDFDSTLRIGCDSVLTFVSNDASGYDSNHNGHIAFDVSNYAYSYFNLEIAGGDQNAYHDGAFLVYGCYMDASYDNPYGYVWDVYWNYFAGNKAMVSTIDWLARNEEAYTEHLAVTPESRYPYYGTDMSDLSRRGLRVINHCRTTNPFAANTFGDFGYRYGDYPYDMRESQVGCVIGVNGVLSIGHNTFLDYIAATEEIPYDAGAMGLLDLDFYTGGSTDYFKRRSPAALLIDGLDYSGGDISWDYDYDGTKHSQAVIAMQGQSSMFVRCCASDYGSYGVDYATNSGVYDGDVIYHGDLSGSPEGHMALDVEGSVIFYHYPDITYDVNWLGVGELNVPSLLLNSRGQEVWSTGDLVDRPLVPGEVYSTYQRSHINLNNDVYFVNNMVFNHNDVLHYVGRQPADVEPALVGGEAASWFGDEALIPFVDLSSSFVACHESLGTAGVRFLVRDGFGDSDAFGFSDPYSFNNSNLVMYNHGNEADTFYRGYGRVLALGSANNLLDDGSTNYLMDSSFLNVFRDHNQIDEDLGLPVQLVLDALPERQYFWNDVSINPAEEAYHIIGMYNDSFIELGWRGYEGYYRYDGGFNYQQNAFPWNLNSGDSFSNDLQDTQAAEMLILGNGFVFEGYDALGNPSPKIVIDDAQPGVVYVGFGGRLVVLDDPYTPHVQFSSPIGLLAYPSTTGNLLYGDVYLPDDQVNYSPGYGVQPYRIDLSLASPNYFDIASLFGDPKTDILKLHWNWILQDIGFGGLKTLDTAETRALKAPRSGKTRATTPIITPVPMPGALLTFGPATDIDQVQIFGSTSLNPFHAYISGDDFGHAVIQEMVFPPSEPAVLGEGEYAALVLDQDAELGLGLRDWNADSVYAGNLLGDNAITLFPNGNCVIHLHSDVIVRDLNSIVPTENFGDVLAGQFHSITFKSDKGHAVRIPAGAELDLSAFGQPGVFGVPTDGDVYDSQRIVFAGNARLILEPGARIRFPDNVFAERSPIIHMAERSEMVIVSSRDLEKPTPEIIDDLQQYRATIQGIGKIWLDDSAKLLILNEAMLGIEADGVRTFNTYVQLHIKRDAQMLIGDQNNKGGAFQVGNPFDTPDTLIGFTMRIEGSDALCSLDRFGFYGLGAGLLAQPEDPVNTWKLISLFNLDFTEMVIVDGTFSHNQIFDGQEGGQGSLFAVGTAGEHDLILGLKDGSKQPIIRGGGNIVYVTPEATEFNPLDLEALPILSSAVELIDDVIEDNGKYNIMGSTDMVRQKTDIPLTAYAAISVIPDTILDTALHNANLCAAAPAGFFQYIGHLSTRFQSPRRYVSFGLNDGQQRNAFIIGALNEDNNIVREDSKVYLNDTDVDRAAAQGYLYVALSMANGDPYSLDVPNNQ